MSNSLTNNQEDSRLNEEAMSDLKVEPEEYDDNYTERELFGGPYVSPVRPDSDIKQDNETTNLANTESTQVSQIKAACVPVGFAEQKSTSSLTLNDKVAEERSIEKFYQKRKSSGTVFPCKYCDCSYRIKGSLYSHMCRNHSNKVAKKVSEGKNISPSEGRTFSCVHCIEIFNSRDLRTRHMKSEHKDILKEEREDEKEIKRKSLSLESSKRKWARESVASKEIDVKPTSIQNVNGKKPLKAVVTQSRRDNKEKQSTSSVFPCSKCRKTYCTVDFLNQHMQLKHTANIRMSCYNCGEVFNFKIEWNQHQHICGTMTDVSAPTGSRKRAINMSETGMPGENNNYLLPPAAKRSFVKEENSQDKLQMYEQSQFPQNEEEAQEITAVVKTEPKELVTSSFCERKPVRSTIINTMEKCYDQKEYKNNSSLMVDNDCMIVEDKHNASRIVNSRASLNVNVTTSVAENRIQKKSDALSVGVAVEAERLIATELWLVWIRNLEQDVLHTVRRQPTQFILCIQTIDMLNLTESERELLKKAQIYTFSILDEQRKTYNLWTVIAFGGSPRSFIEKKLFNSFSEVETIFSTFARNKGNILNNVMRYDGLFSILSEYLQEKITAFNHIS